MTYYIRLYGMVCILCLLVLLQPAYASGNEDVAWKITSMLAKKFNPERVEVTVLDSHAYAVMRGAVISKIRIDTMRLEAVLNDVPQGVSADANDLPRYIAFSKGELVLLEKDVNIYFAKNEKGGFSKLSFDFINDGFKASGMYRGKFIITINIRLDAEGILTLKRDGIYLDKVAIFVEKIKQPVTLTNQIMKSINPLLEFKDIPFPVEFKAIRIDTTKAVLTGYPQNFEGGSTAVWKRP